MSDHTAATWPKIEPSNSHPAPRRCHEDWADYAELHEDEFEHPNDFMNTGIVSLPPPPKSFNASYSDLPYKRKCEGSTLRCNSAPNFSRGRPASDVRDAARAISLVADLDGPLRAVSMRVVDLDGRVVIEGETPRK